MFKWESKLCTNQEGITQVMGYELLKKVIVANIYNSLNSHSGLDTYTSGIWQQASCSLTPFGVTLPIGSFQTNIYSQGHVVFLTNMLIYDSIGVHVDVYTLFL